MTLTFDDTADDIRNVCSFANSDKYDRSSPTTSTTPAVSSWHKPEI